MLFEWIVFNSDLKKFALKSTQKLNNMLLMIIINNNNLSRDHFDHPSNIIHRHICIVSLV